MPPEHEIDYTALIDRTISDFQPVQRLWRVRTRLSFWILLESAILVTTGFFLGDFSSAGIDKTRLLLGSGVPILASIGAAFLALRGAIPGREITSRELVLLIALVCLAILMPSGHSPASINQSSATAELSGLAAMPWLILFWAVRRGVPLQPETSGAIVGLSAFSFTLAILRLIHHQDGLPEETIWLIACGFLLTAASALAGRFWLDWVDRWQRFSVSNEVRPPLFAVRLGFPVAVAASITAFIFVVWSTTNHVVITDFDLTIESYQTSITGFRPNVPSASVESVLTAYVEHGMPAYMWDFGPQGFKLIGGRWQPLTDGTPVTYTWFHGSTGGVICMMRQTEAFNPPAGAREVHRGILFYRYRGFSLCLINIGGYGTFISVIAARMAMERFVPMVLQAVH